MVSSSESQSEISRLRSQNEHLTEEYESEIKKLNAQWEQQTAANLASAIRELKAELGLQINGLEVQISKQKIAVGMLESDKRILKDQVKVFSTDLRNTQKKLFETETMLGNERSQFRQNVLLLKTELQNYQKVLVTEQHLEARFSGQKAAYEAAFR